MKRKILLGPYEWNEYHETWISEEKITEGTVRTIEGELYHATLDWINFDKPQYDIHTGKDYITKEVIVWIRIES